MSVPSHLLSAVFSDETPTFRFPSEPDPGDSVTIRLRVRIPHPGRSRLQINKKVLNIRWEIPEEAPTTEEALLLLAATEMIL